MYKYIIFLALAFLSCASTAAVNIDLSFAENNEGVVFSGKTDLPSGTKLGVILKGDGDYKAQDYEIFVSNGKFFTQRFSNQGAPLVGKFTVTVDVIANDIWQKNPQLRSALQALPEFTGNYRFSKDFSATLGATLAPSAKNLSRSDRNQEQLKAIIRQVMILPCKQGGSVGECLDGKAAIPAVSDHGWTVRSIVDGNEVERHLQIEGLQSKTSYRWVVYSNGQTVASNGHAMGISGGQVTNTRSVNAHTHSGNGLRPGEKQIYQSLKADDRRKKRSRAANRRYEANRQRANQQTANYNKSYCKESTARRNQYRDKKRQGYTISQGKYYDERIASYERRMKQYCK